MVLSCRILTDVANVNEFAYVTQASFVEGDTVSVYFQLIDASKDRYDQGFNPSGRRYAPAVGAALTVSVLNIDNAKVVSRSAVQPFPNDPSIWRLDLSSTDKVRGTTSLGLALTEGAKVTHGSAQAVISVVPLTPVIYSDKVYLT